MRVGVQVFGCEVVSVCVSWGMCGRVSGCIGVCGVVHCVLACVCGCVVVCVRVLGIHVCIPGVIQ